MLDAAVAVVPNHLAGVILEPLSPALVEDHKAAVVEAFCAESPRNRALFKTKHAYWTTTKPVSDRHFLMAELATYGAPLAVKTLARRIKRDVPEAEFSLQWFYDDPILDVIYRGEVTHVAIWNRGQVLAIAKTMPPRRRWFDWFRR